MEEVNINDDDQVLTDLINRLAPEIVLWLKGKTKSLDDAKDIFQEGSIKLFEEIQKGRLRKGNTKAWLKTVCNNIFIDRIRKTKKKKAIKIGSFSGLSMDVLIDYFYSMSIDEFVEGEQEGLDDHQLKLLRMLPIAFDKLGEKCRQLLNLSIIEEISSSMIAEKLDYKDITVVRARKWKCLKTLRSEYFKLINKNEK